MKTYANVGPRNAITPQSEPIPGSSQQENNAGGFSYVIDDWQRLERFLVLGTDGGTYYVNEKKLTRENASVVERCIKVDGVRTVRAICDISASGRAAKNDPSLFALAMCASFGNTLTRSNALVHMDEVARTGTHLLHFISFVEQFRGWGRGLRGAIANWFNEKSPMDLAYQITKYPSRDGWSMRDALRLAHVKPADDAHSDLLKWAVGKGADVNWSGFATAPGDYMAGLELIAHTSDPKTAAQIIRDCKLPREVVPTELLNHAVVWEALLQDMPMTAMIRNLATMTRVGLITPMSDASMKIAEQLTNTSRLHKARVHPIQILAALTTYASGHGVRGKNTWIPITKITDALNDAFYLSFGNVEPSNKRTLLALDVSRSMSFPVIGIPGLSARTASAAMALVTANVEQQHHFLAFSDGRSRGLMSPLLASGDQPIIPLDISPKQRLDNVVKAMDLLPFGGTDCALPMLWAAKNNVPVDVFTIYTDSESWAGKIHASQALRDYRQKTGIPAKLVVVATTATEFSVGDPNDAGTLNCCGFDTSTPNIISDFARNDVMR